MIETFEVKRAPFNDENSGGAKQVYDMGNKSIDIFRGHSNSDAIREIYGESAQLFADIIKSKLPNSQEEYKLLDIGSSKGELLSDILKFLPDYHFDITVTDTNPDAVAENCIPGKKIVTDAESLPFDEGSMDLILMRYVLQFNSFESQKKIISEIARTVGDVAIIQHGGSDGSDPDAWRRKVDQIFIDEDLPQIKRKGMFWSSCEEIEKFMTTHNIKFERVLSKKIPGLSQPFIERYSLSEAQILKLKQILEDKDYLVQTTWIIYPKEN